MKVREIPETVLCMRKCLKLSQSKLGEKAGISRNYVSAIERGYKLDSTSLSVIVKVFEALGYRLDIKLEPK